MDLDEAHRILGLYVGAAPDHVRRQHEERSRELLDSGSSNVARQRQLDLARDVALGHRPAANRPGRKVRGWVLLAVVLAAIGVYTAAKFGMGAFLDDDQERRKTERIGQLARDAQTAWQTFAEAEGLGAIEVADSRLAEGDEAHARKAYKDALAAYDSAYDGYVAGFRGQEQAVRESWEKLVVGNAETRLWPFFPFNPDADEDAPLELVTELFNPVSGAAWAVLASINRLNEVEIQNLRVARYDVDPAFLRRAELVRDVLFGRQEELNVRFEIKLTGSHQHRNVQFELGAQVVSAASDEFVAINWCPDNTTATVRVGQTRTPAFEVVEGDSPWGLLRLLARMKPVESAEPGVYRWQFERESVALRRRERERDWPATLTDPLTIHIKPTQTAHPFANALSQN